MDWHPWALFLGTNFLLSLTPGPAVTLVVGHSLSNGAMPAQGSILGILGGNAIYIVLSALGLGALLLAAPGPVLAIKTVGCAYLVWTGWRCMSSRAGSLYFAQGKRGRPSALFRQALALQLSNPKSILFFGAMLPQFIQPGWPAIPQMLTLGFAALLLEYPVLTAYSVAGAQLQRLQGPRAIRTVNVAAGMLLVIAAVRVWLASA